jgi:hypothetical protein
LAAGRAPWARAITIAAMALALGSCGSGDSEGAKDSRRAAPDEPRLATPQERRQIATAVDEVQRAFVAGDMRRLCGRMTATAKAEAGLFGHDVRESCPKDLRQAFHVIDLGGGMRHRGQPRVARAEISGDRATAFVELGGRTGAAPLVERAGRWMLAGFVGLPASEGQRLDERAKATPFPAAGAQSIEAVDADAKPCSRFDATARDADCPFSVRGARVAISILTVYGDFTFGDCEIELYSAVDGEGRTWTWFDAGGGQQARWSCIDVDPCDEGIPDEAVLWKGRLRSDPRGALVHEVDACVRSAVGYFEGRLSMPLARAGESSRQPPATYAVGDSGLELDGPLTSDMSRVRIRPPRP